MITENENFDWVGALASCSFPAEFMTLKCLVEKNVKRRNEIFPGPDYLARTGSSFVEVRSITDHKFMVIRHDIQAPTQFFLDLDEERIVVDLANGDVMILNVTLTDTKKCRFRINGEGEYLYWQVCCRALKDLFFSPSN